MSSWSRQDDKIFEKALIELQEGIEKRWDRIAYLLPGKSADEVRAHYEALIYDVCEIDSGRVELPSYSDELWDEQFGAGSPDLISFGSKRTRHAEVERKRGTPWTPDEHRLFLVGLDRYGKGDWRSISRNVVVSRTATQVASHAQKFFLRQNSGKTEKKRSSIHDITTAAESLPVPVPVPVPTNLHNQGDSESFSFPMPR